MYKIIFALLLIACITACSKDADPVTENNDIEGTWLWTEQRSDPGDGSGTWRPADTTAWLVFDKGTFKDSRNDNFNRYIYQDSIITLFKANTTDTLKLSVLEFNNAHLRYYLNIPVCGGPTGDAFTRIVPID